MQSLKNKSLMALRKLRTALNYLFVGIRLGEDFSSKANLGTMLIRYKAQLALGVPSRIYSVRIRGLQFPVYLRDEDIDLLYAIFWRKDYWFEGLSKVPHSCVVLDLGAHIGLFTLWFKGMFPEARIFCFEPDHENFELLKKNTESLKDVTVCPIAVGARSGVTEFSVHRYRHALSSLKGDTNHKRTYQVRCEVRSLDDIFEETGVPDLIKFDIEGMEPTFRTC